MNWAMTALKKHFSPLDPSATAPLYRQIYDRIRSAISSETLKPGDRVPSVRALAGELGLARGTVDTAYSLLVAEGYIQPRGQAGTVVSPDLTSTVHLPGPAPAVRPYTASFRPDTILPFQMGLPALDAFPRKIWARLGARSIRALQASGMAHPPVAGVEALRSEIASYLQVSRGISCSPAQVFVTSGYRHTLELISHALLKAGDKAWVENPGFPPTRWLFAHLNIEAVPVPVDSEGLVVSEGLALAPEARAVVVTPSHQSPLCVTLTLSRRMALLEWAAQRDAWIVEDDYDGEYRYVSRPLPALKSLDHEGRVLYAGTFSKVLFPGLRLAYLVVPEAKIPRFEDIARTFVGGSPYLTQAIVTAFIREGHFARHIQRMRKLYAERRSLTVKGLMNVLFDRITIDAQPGGMHLVLRLPPDYADHDLVARLLANGLYAEALSDCTLTGDGAPGLLLNFTNIASADVAESLARRIRAQL
jgi:GntR family transcriptional regulator/MocR family aminotransferase